MALFFLRGGLTSYLLWAITVFLFLIFHFNINSTSTPRSDFNFQYDKQVAYAKPTRPANTQLSRSELLALRQASFCSSYFSLVTRHRPQCDPLVHPEDTDLSIGYDSSIPSPQRPQLLNMTQVQFQTLRDSHKSFIHELSGITLPYVSKSRGLVTTAGGRYLPVAAISLRMIRESGSKLPMEVFLASREEWDSDVCEDIFPALNAKCIVLDEIFKNARVSVKIEKYQFKAISIMLSSFEDVLFLDSDAFSLFNPDRLFDVEPYNSTGLVLWPDFWFPSESPLFFDITGIDMPPLNLKSSTESGQILLSKTKHSDSLMLAAYYNIYGPEFYYPLQSQGAPGEGDKETFGWAAKVMRKMSYSVKSKVAALGYMTAKGEFRGSAMAQHDPEEDFSGQTTPKVFFIHANYPKFDPATIFESWSVDAPGPTMDTDGRLTRVWNHINTAIATSEIGYDVERRFWTQVMVTACADEKKFTSWENHTAICQNTVKYWNYVFGLQDGESKHKDGH